MSFHTASKATTRQAGTFRQIGTVSSARREKAQTPKFEDEDDDEDEDDFLFMFIGLAAVLESPEQVQGAGDLAVLGGLVTQKFVDGLRRRQDSSLSAGFLLIGVDGGFSTGHEL